MPMLENGHRYPGAPYTRTHLLGCDKCGYNIILDGVAVNPICPECGNRLLIYSGNKDEIENKQKDLLKIRR